MRIATLVIALLLILNPWRAQAQTFEVGAGLALSCYALEESPCDDKWGRTDAVHVAWWSTPSIVVEARVAHLDGPATRIVNIPERISASQNFYRSYLLRDERRTSLQASVLYHFRAGHQVLPFVGGGAGSLWWRGEARCDASLIDCERVLPPNAPGVLHMREWAASFAGGVAVEAGRHTIVRAGLHSTSSFWAMAHRTDDGRDPERGTRGELPEYFFNVGYRW